MLGYGGVARDDATTDRVAAEAAGVGCRLRRGWGGFAEVRELGLF